VHTSSGEKTVRVDQRKEPAINVLFTSLGNFDLDRQTAEIVVSNDGTDGYVVVDGIQLIRTGDKRNKQDRNSAPTGE
jgi:hypothetical protein